MKGSSLAASENTYPIKCVIEFDEESEAYDYYGPVFLDLCKTCVIFRFSLKFSFCLHVIFMTEIGYELQVWDILLSKIYIMQYFPQIL